MLQPDFQTVYSLKIYSHGISDPILSIPPS